MMVAKLAWNEAVRSDMKTVAMMAGLWVVSEVDGLAEKWASSTAVLWVVEKAAP